MEVGETPAGYSVQAQHPETEETVGESFADIKDAVARAALASVYRTRREHV